jgi:hypothetical protein
MSPNGAALRAPALGGGSHALVGDGLAVAVEGLVLDGDEAGAGEAGEQHVETAAVLGCVADEFATESTRRHAIVLQDGPQDEFELQALARVGGVMPHRDTVFGRAGITHTTGRPAVGAIAEILDEVHHAAAMRRRRSVGTCPSRWARVAS